jgi:serine O-acetyltransferase
LHLFRKDAARWIIPQSVGDPEAVTFRTAPGLLLRHPPLRAMAWFRFGSAMHQLGVRALPGWSQRRLLRLYGLEMSSSAEVGGGFYIAHPVGCVLEAEHIGDNVTVISQVTFGTRTDGRWPVIEDECFFGVGCRVLGGIRIGAGAQVGANAVVLSDVAKGQVVAGVPASPIR